MKNTWVLTISLVALIFAIGAGIGFKMISDNEERKEIETSKPKFYNPDDIIDTDLVDPNLIDVKAGHTVAEFRFINHLGDTITSQDIREKVTVVDYFFTTCKGICPRMTNQMGRVQEAFKDEDELVILSHTVLPHVDSVETLRAYAKKHNAIEGKWHFLTGEKEELYRLARQSYFVLKPAEVEGGGDGGSDFIHTNQFVLVDHKGRIRGYYNGTDEEDVDRLMKDIRYLLDHE